MFTLFGFERKKIKEINVKGVKKYTSNRK